MAITYCVKCVTPSTRPGLRLDESGVCDACRNFDLRKKVNWDLRKQELLDVLKRYRRANGDYWDCIVPVSGGKDSTYQALTMLELGMNPLCVTGTTCHLSDIGRRNIENIKNLGVDFMEVTPNLVIRRKLNRIALTQIGDISWPEHAGIFTVPIRASVQFSVPLIIWGENPQNEYGGHSGAAQSNVMDKKWLDEHGGLLGLRTSMLKGISGIEARHLIPYTYPTDDELAKVGVTGIFLGHYFPWDGFTNSLYSQAYGFETTPGVVEGSMVNYENLDNYQTGIHDYFKFLKFGFGRTTDIASLHIRRNRITREQGLAIVRMRDGKFPWSYLGKPLHEILEPLELSIEDFIQICDRFTNRGLFLRDASENLVKDRSGSLTKINYDNV